MKDKIIEKQKQLIEHIIPFTERCTIEETYKIEYQKWVKKRKRLESELAALENNRQQNGISADNLLTSKEHREAEEIVEENFKGLYDLIDDKDIVNFYKDLIVTCMEQYHRDRIREELRDELILFCCDCNVKLPEDKDYIDLVDEYLKDK
jgi:hypothetical protein